jgi:NTP pyrophosphatase (non-canonical NTP hydrolase)
MNSSKKIRNSRDQLAADKGILENPWLRQKKTEVEELLEAVDAQEKDTTFTNIKAKKVNTEEEIKDAFGDILVTIIELKSEN